jgi:transcriptional regulator with XRE-family HTH domain
MQKSLGTRKHAILRRILRERRLAAGLTQRQLAERLGTVHSRIGGYENEDRRMDLVQLEEYSVALGVPLLELVAEYVKATEQDLTE